MAAAINFFAGQNFAINNISGSGLGFYGDAGFAASVSVGAYQGRTYITDSNGTSQGAEVANVKYLSAPSGILGQTSSGLPLICIPNYQATLNIRFTNDSAVKTQNVSVRFYDRVSINNDPSGVTVKCAEIRHPALLQSATGSGDTTWVTPRGSAVTMTLVASPGVSGERPAGANTTATQHDHYLAISCSPDTIGSKLFAVYASLEYL